MNNDEVNSFPYRNLVGALQYLVTGSRMEIGNAVRTLAKFTNCFTKLHWKMALRVLRYLAGTNDFGLVYDLCEAKEYRGLTIEAWCDADYANDREDRKSITGYVMKINGQLVSARSCKQEVIATSTCHAEVVSASQCAREVVWMEMLLYECHLHTENSTLYIDNHGAAILCQRPGSHKGSKHFDVRHLNVREYVEQRNLQIKTVSTKDNIADILTKPLGEMAFVKFRESLGIRSVKLALDSCTTEH